MFYNIQGRFIILSTKKACGDELLLLRLLLMLPKKNGMIVHKLARAPGLMGLRVLTSDA